jgi:ferrochelatase
MAAMRAISPTRKTAIVLFNLGGPDTPEAVQPFLFNLFNDPAIIGLPSPFRTWLAKFISKKRAPKAQGIYNEIGGKSPILENTLAQANALESSLAGHGQVKVFISMRYWHPLAGECVRKVKEYNPDHIILLPLYPQFSTTTTGSSFKEWDELAKMHELNTPTSHVCCYPAQREFVEAHAQLIRGRYDEAKKHGAPRILFSAHGLPEKIVKRGDPYQMQVELGTQAVLEELRKHGLLGSSPLEGEPNRTHTMSSMAQNSERDLVGGANGATKTDVGAGGEIPPTKSAGNTAPQHRPRGTADLAPPQGGSARSPADIDYVNCYQSRVGPLKWIGPSTEDELRRAGADGVPVVLVPIAFVSEHSETLVELDIEYKHLAEEAGVKHYARVPTLSTDAHFIAALADICLKQTTQGGLAPDTGTRICGREWGACLCNV